MASRGIDFKAMSNFPFKDFELVNASELENWSGEDLLKNSSVAAERVNRRPWMPDAEVDDYDPRKPEYIISASPEEAEAQQAELLKKQVACLQSVLTRRKDEYYESPAIMKHYQHVLRDMTRVVGVSPKHSQISAPARNESRSKLSESATTLQAQMLLGTTTPCQPSIGSVHSTPRIPGFAETTIALPRKSGIVRLPSSLESRRDISLGVGSFRAPVHIGLRSPPGSSSRIGQSPSSPAPSVRSFCRTSPAQLRRTSDVVRVGATGVHPSLRCVPQRAPP
jgi:hypothetical protein